MFSLIYRQTYKQHFVNIEILTLPSIIIHKTNLVFYMTKLKKNYKFFCFFSEMFTTRS